MTKHFLTIEDYQTDELQLILDQAFELKKLYLEGGRDECLKGKTAALLFEKPSSRTRISFQVAMTQLGGASIYLKPEDIGGLGKREPVRDLTRVLNGYVDTVIARTFAHESVLELTRYATMPVINALTDLAHPCQALADIMTVQEHCGQAGGLKIAYVGDGNNVSASLGMLCIRLGVNFTIARPKNYAMNADFVKRLKNQADGCEFNAVTDPFDAVKDADVIYTDTWTSMGQEEEKAQRVKDFAGYQVDGKLVSAAKPNAIIMHCLPAYRGLEISDEVIESPQSVVFDQAENRLHAQRALIRYLLCETNAIPVSAEISR